MTKMLQQILELNLQNLCDRKSLTMVRSLKDLRSGTAEKDFADVRSDRRTARNVGDNGQWQEERSSCLKVQGIMVRY
ncbi:hypothetical protein, partial [Mesorhizobium sp. M1E.F.Ca.ET.041.01.1.1]|uniref:hypothetical protein n=1 Tax=Mesorhizobium sp. M1E.F.Ca.ET.041.01.1.1 TaxID=2496759 RepID=UPI001AECD1AD